MGKATPKSDAKGKSGKNKDDEGKGIVDTIKSFFRGKDPRTPVKGVAPRIKNVVLMHFRGLFGMLVPICALTWQGKKGVNSITVQCMWLWMLWFFLLQPVAIPATGLIPIFILPMAGVMPTIETCVCYMNENIVLFILTGMLLLLLNNSGVDRRIALKLLCSGDACQFSGKRLVFKCSTAAFFLSMFSSRLITSSMITQMVTPALMDLQSATSRYRDSEPDYDEMRYIINNAIQTASAIGSTAILHSAYATLCFKAIWCQSAPKGTEYPDIFNYMQYSAFAFPVALLIHILNFAYHMMLINRFVGKPMSSNSMNELRKSLLKHKSSLPPSVTVHEKLTVFFSILALIVFFFRWSSFLEHMGWAAFSKEKGAPEIPGLKDATVAALFVIALHILPKSFGFVKLLIAEKRSELPPNKPESAILWWRFVDKNLNYGYMFLIGSGVALQAAIQDTGLDKIIGAHFGKAFTGRSWNTSLFLVCLVTVIFANVMTGVAACVSFLPFVLSMAVEPKAKVFRSHPWPSKVYVGALGVGVGCSFGYMFPFMYTPAYFCHYTGKVPVKKMAKYSIGSVIISLIVLWLALVYWAPYLWDPTDKGITPVATATVSPSGNGTTHAGAGPAAKPTPPPPGPAKPPAKKP
ncbi:protein I'm not dead yet-like [Bombyx mandarina]|uniref:Protein I'm not dead yet-like n=1 Tax=Bombyx mandarina TaxID=7092 RepID=A0A6J2KP25_BOMMA|nr:protein I'm not dead yet-like [Bombyx mandarina]